MDEQGSHRQNTPAPDETVKRPQLPRQVLHLVGRENTESVACRKYPERTVALGRVVEMNPQREEAAQARRRRLRICYACLYRPRALTGDLLAVTERQRGVLVPRHQPVR